MDDRPNGASWFARRLSRQASHPTGWFGRMLGRIWLLDTAAVNDEALRLLKPAAGEHILELGFGPGRAIGRLVQAGASVTGVDVSEEMVALADRRNRRAVDAGTVSLHRGDGTSLPVDDDTIDAALSVHTLYFWDDYPKVARELARTIKPAGRLVLGIRDPDIPLPSRLDPEIYTTLDRGEIQRLLLDAGFADVEFHSNREVSRGSLWVVATTGGTDR
ncbi:MAG: methyltransferase domain-containing protein [Nitriliruptorales bacterium]|nr:methyltransferase domain-containing protein [Nitriliruptorales bacterium]